MLSAHTKQPEQ